MGDAADGEQGAEMGQRADTPDQELAAGGDLSRDRLVLRRHAAHRVRDHAVDQLERLRGRGVVPPVANPNFSSVR